MRIQYKLQEPTDWRSFRARLVALEKRNSELTTELESKSAVQDAWVHELSLPEKGCLLLGRLENMEGFTHAVVLLCQHGMLLPGPCQPAASYHRLPVVS